MSTANGILGISYFYFGKSLLHNLITTCFYKNCAQSKKNTLILNSTNIYFTKKVLIFRNCFPEWWHYFYDNYENYYYKKSSTSISLQ